MSTAIATMGEKRAMNNYGLTSVYDFLGDLIVYRNLTPQDRRLPTLDDIRTEVGLGEGVIPRKSEPEYARAVAHLLKLARALDAPGATIERLAYLGDTHLNDGTAFANICQAGGWSGLAFIGAEKGGPEEMVFIKQEEGTLCLSNRWAALTRFEDICRDWRFPLDERTAAIIDLDKTALGARGRNDRVIDQARVEAVRRTVDDLLGEAFDREAFQATYDRLNQPEFHPFTTDNQDYLAYICLILGSGLYRLETLIKDIQSGRLAGFKQFIGEVDGRAGDLPGNLRDIHASVYGYVQAGDPTPFKAFRYNEYRTTTERMGALADDAPADDLLKQEIVITQEVRAAALAWREKGVLLFALSDKPDEASVPPEELAALGNQPIHRTATHAVGE